MYGGGLNSKAKSGTDPALEVLGGPAELLAAGSWYVEIWKSPLVAGYDCCDDLDTVATYGCCNGADIVFVYDCG